MKKPLTLKDIDRLVHIAGVKIDYIHLKDIRKMGRQWIKYLDEQEKLHWKYMNNSIGDNPSCEVPKGFNSEHELMYGYKAARKLIREVFNLKEKKEV